MALADSDSMCTRRSRSAPSAAAQVGGVLEPVNAAPVVIEDEVVVGGNCGVYEGTVVRAVSYTHLDVYKRQVDGTYARDSPP